MADGPLNEELFLGLRQARKKARNFALIAKGPKPLHLIVRKKPIKVGELQKAKTEYKGNVIIRGICEGDGGAAMVFKVLEEDPGIKPLKLRELIAEQTELTIKPRFEVVSEIVEVDDDEEDEAESEAKNEEAPNSPESPQMADEVPPAPPPPPEASSDALGKQVIAALNKLAPALKEAVTANPARREELLRPAARVQQLVQEGEYEDAKQELLKLGQLLKSTGSPPPAPPPPPAPTATPTQQPVEADQAQEALGQKWREQLEEIEPQYQEALRRAPSSLASKLRVTFTYATEQGEAQQFGKAMAALQRLAPLIDEAMSLEVAGAAGEVRAGVVEQRKYLVTRFKQIPGEIRPKVDELKRAIEQNVPEEDADELCTAIEEALEQFYNDLQDQIDDAINAGDATVLTDLRRQVESHQLLDMLARNPMTPGDAFRQTLLTALDEIEEHLAS